MKTLSIYEKGRNCSGLCDSAGDPELIRIYVAIPKLRKSGVNAIRYNLSASYEEFVKNAEVSKLLAEKGEEVLPITIVDGKIVITGHYPQNAELIELLGISEDVLN
jgi:hypothetical protein